MAKAGLAADLFAEADFTAPGGVAATAELLRRPDRPTAIVYANDLMATSGQSYAQSQGLSVPGDLSVTGYDNAEFTQYLNPPLTTISTDPMLWGRTAAQVLLDQLNGTHSGEDTDLQAPVLLVRASTGPAPAEAAGRSSPANN